MAKLNIDFTNIQPQAAFENLPVGWYHMKVVNTERKPTKDHATTKAEYLSVEYEIHDGAHAGRKIFGNFNIENANQQTVEIAYKQLSALARACGHLVVEDSSILHNIVFKGRVKTGKGSEGYEPRSEVADWKHISDPSGPAVGATAGVSPPAGFGAPSGAPALPAGFPGAATAAAPSAPAAPAAPAAPVAPPAPVVFPPADWIPHPETAGYFYRGQECLSEADLKAKIEAEAPKALAAPAAPATPASPAATTASPAAAASGAPTPPWIKK